MGETHENLLNVDGLVKNYGKQRAVDHLSFSVNEGECYALLGPNGAGKTTTIEILEGLQHRDEGRVSIFGKDIKQNRTEILPHIGVQLQETVLYQKYTVKETLQLFASFFPEHVDLDSLIAKLDLDDVKDKRLQKLSGGQRQRVNVAVALINSPKLVFLDEPTTGLDPQSRRNLWDLIKQIKSENRSILLTTHYLDEAEILADRIGIMVKGRLIAEGSAKELVLKYCGAQALWFHFKEDCGSSAAQEDLFKLQTELPWLEKAKMKDGGFIATASVGVEAIQSLVRCTDKLGIKLTALELRDSTLEDVFLELTGRSYNDADQ